VETELARVLKMCQFFELKRFGNRQLLINQITVDSQTILMMQNERLGVRFEMDSKGDIWSTSVQLLKSLDAIDPVILGITKFAPKEELGSHLVIGGRNSSESISQLTTLNGISIEKLEADMRPGRPTDIVSSEGFLGPHESLKGILIKDNETVLNQLHLTNQEIAYHLKWFVERVDVIV
jgi:hypothetical protein